MTRDLHFCISDLIAAIAAAVPERTAFVTPERRTSWPDFDARVTSLARAFADAGLGCRGDVSHITSIEDRVGSVQDHIGLLCGNSPEYIESMVAAFRARAVPVNMNYRYTADELVYLIENADLSAVVYDARFAPALADAIERHPVARLIRIDDGSGTAAVDGSVEYEDFRRATSDVDLPEPSEDDRYILYTGGTTGFPKGVVWRQIDWFMAAMNGAARGYTDARQPVERAREMRPLIGLAASPFMHGGGHWAAFNILMQGGTVVLPEEPDRLDPGAIWRTVERERVVFMQVIGDAFLGPLVDELEAGTYDVTSLRFLLTSGAIASPAHKQAMLALIPKLRILDTIGASETGGTAVAKGAADDPAPQFELESTATVLSLDGGDIAAVGEEGLLAQRGWVPLGYYKDVGKTERTFPVVDGVRYSAPGDHAVRLEDGRIVLLGRGSGCINTGGEKVYPEEVEQQLKSHPAVADVLVAGVPDPKWGEAVGAVVQLRNGAELGPDGAQALSAHLREHIAGFKVPKRWIVGHDAVRRNQVGKPDYEWAREVLSARPPVGSG